MVHPQPNQCALAVASLQAIHASVCVRLTDSSNMRMFSKVMRLLHKRYQGGVDIAHGRHHPLCPHSRGDMAVMTSVCSDDESFDSSDTDKYTKVNSHLVPTERVIGDRSVLAPWHLYSVLVN